MVKRSNAVKQIQYSDILTQYDGAQIPVSGIKSGNYNGMATSLRVRIKHITEQETKQIIESRNESDTICSNCYAHYRNGVINYYLYRAIVRIMSYKINESDLCIFGVNALTNKMRLRNLLNTALLDYKKSGIKLSGKELRYLYRVAKRNTFVDYDKIRESYKGNSKNRASKKYKKVA